MLFIILASIIFIIYVVFSLITIKSRLSEIEKKLGMHDLPKLSDEEIKRGIEKEKEQEFFNNLNK